MGGSRPASCCPGAEQLVLGRRECCLMHPRGRGRLPVGMARLGTWVFLPWPSLCHLSPYLQGHGGPMGPREVGEAFGCPP